MRCAGHVAQMGEKMNAYGILMGKPEIKNQYVSRWIILKWILDRMGW
jgi:hypothetical protein